MKSYQMTGVFQANSCSENQFGAHRMDSSLVPLSLLSLVEPLGDIIDVFPGEKPDQ